MAPWLPRMQVFEFHDQSWFPPWFRGKVQAALTETWLASHPPIQPVSPATHVSRILAAELGPRAAEHVFIDFCAGGGGPTPTMERHINNERRDDANTTPHEPVHFVLTDLHPHIPNWTRATLLSPNVHYSPLAVDASAAPPDLLATVQPPLPPSSEARKPFRIFNLAFHHFADPLAAKILRNTMETASGFAIFELQDRSFTSFLAICLLGLGVMVFAPKFAWRWRSFGTLFWCWVVPVLPFVLVWDGWMSAVRTRTVDEVEDLMAGCGVGKKELRKWKVRNGRVTHLPPWAEVNWIIATKIED